jgi:hypothetical protein
VKAVRRRGGHLQLVIAKMKREIFDPRAERSHGSSSRWNCSSRKFAAGVREDAAKLAATSVQVRGLTRRKATGLSRSPAASAYRSPGADLLPRCGGTRLSKIGEDVAETTDTAGPCEDSVPAPWPQPATGAAASALPCRRRHDPPRSIPTARSLARSPG